jgi:uncharacterized membrane protein required for colicin V production
MVLTGHMFVFGIIRGLVVSVLTFTVARYLGTSKAVAAFYAQSPAPASVGANPSIKRTGPGKPGPAAHVER